MERPFGVTLLAALHIALGLLVLAGGITFLAGGFFIPEIFPHVQWFAVRSTVLGMGLLIFAVIDFVLAYGLWLGKHWAWALSFFFAALGLAFSTFSLFVRPGAGELFSLILELAILYYLMQPRVQAYFGRRTQLVPAQSGMPLADTRW